MKPIPQFPNYFCTEDGIVLDKFFKPLKTYAQEEPPFYPPWKVSKKKKKINPYLMVHLNRAIKSVHSLVARTWVTNPRPDIFFCVDHIDRNEHNNHPSNLRWVTQTFNRQNNCGLNTNFVKKCKKKNMFFTMNKWNAKVTVNGLAHYLGWYKTFREAYLVSKAFKLENFARNYKYTCNESPRTSNYLFLD